MANNGTSS